MTPTEKRFWGKVAIGDRCWEWQASKISAGYGRFQLSGRAQLAHRVAYSLANGVDLPYGRGAGALVLHTCDNRACVRPGHLVLGSYQDNADHMVARARQARGSKLSAEALEEIRDRANGRKALAQKHGISVSLISKIRDGRRLGAPRSWKT